MSKTIEELETAVADARLELGADHYDIVNQHAVDTLLAAQERLTAQKYEAIIEERVQETVKQRLTKPQPGDVVHTAWQELRATKEGWRKALHTRLYEIFMASSPAEEALGVICDELE
jgi:hypothetical protein